MAVAVVDRNFGDRRPDFAPLGVGEFFQLADQGLAGPDDPLLVFVESLRQLPGMKIKIRLAHDLLRVFQAQPKRHRIAAAQEARFHVLEINPVGNVVQQRAQKIAFVGEGFFDFLALRHVPENPLDAHHPAHRIVEGCFDDVDEPFLAAVRGMGLHRLESLHGGHHPRVVPMVFVGQLLREKIMVGSAQDFRQRLAEGLAEFPVGEGEAPLHVLAQDVLREGFHQRLVERLRVPEPVLRALMVLDPIGQFEAMAAQLQVGAGLPA